MVSISDHDRQLGQDEYMTHGVTHEKTEEQKVQAQQQLNFKNESDFMQNVIDQRKEDINTIAELMSNINDIAKDIAIETSAQGEKLEKLDENITVADENASKALKELQQAQVHSKKTGRCQYLLVSIIVMCLLILILSIAL